MTPEQELILIEDVSIIKAAVLGPKGHPEHSIMTRLDTAERNIKNIFRGLSASALAILTGLVGIFTKQ